MKMTIRPVRKLAHLLLPLLALTGLNAHADSHVPPPPGALEAFLCTYNPGKGRADLNAATVFYLKQAEKAGITPPPAYLWTLIKGTGPVDIAWMNVHESLSAFGAAMDANMASSEMTAVTDRYNTVASCQPNLGVVTTVFEREGADDDAPTTLATYGCNLRPGVGPVDLAGVTSHIAEWNKSLGDKALNGVYQIVPMTRTPETADVVMVAVARNTAEWASHIESLNASPAGQATNSHFNSVLDCSVSLWRSEQVVADSEG